MKHLVWYLPILLLLCGVIEVVWFVVYLRHLCINCRYRKTQSHTELVLARLQKTATPLHPPGEMTAIARTDENLDFLLDKPHRQGRHECKPANWR